MRSKRRGPIPIARAAGSNRRPRLCIVRLALKRVPRPRPHGSKSPRDRHGTGSEITCARSRTTTRCLGDMALGLTGPAAETWPVFCLNISLHATLDFRAGLRATACPSRKELCHENLNIRYKSAILLSSGMAFAQDNTQTGSTTGADGSCRLPGRPKHPTLLTDEARTILIPQAEFTTTWSAMPEA